MTQRFKCRLRVDPWDLYYILRIKTHLFPLLSVFQDFILAALLGKIPSAKWQDNSDKAH